MMRAYYILFMTRGRDAMAILTVKYGPIFYFFKSLYVQSQAYDLKKKTVGEKIK